MSDRQASRGASQPSEPTTFRAPTPFHLERDARCLITLVLAPDFALGDLARLLDVFHTANDMAARPAFHWQIVSEASDPVASSAGICVTPAGGFNEVSAYPNVIILGSGKAAPALVTALARWIKRHSETIERIGGIGEGMDIVERLAMAAATGAATARRRTDLYWQGEAGFGCRGGCATSDLALTAVEAALGPSIARRVLRKLARQQLRREIDRNVEDRFSTESKAPPPVKKAIAAMRQTVGEPLAMAEIARICNVHLRHLQRLFERHMGMAPRDYYLRLRLLKARDLVYDTTMGLAQIATAVGFDSLSHFSKCYTQAYGTRPSADRHRHFTTPGASFSGLEGESLPRREPTTSEAGPAARVH